MPLKLRHLIVLQLKSLNDHICQKTCKPIIVDNVLIATAKITKIFYPDAVNDNFDHRSSEY